MRRIEALTPEKGLPGLAFSPELQGLMYCQGQARIYLFGENIRKEAMSHAYGCFITHHFMALLALSAGSPGSVSAQGNGEQAFRCKPTKPDQLGPMYEPNAPVRSRVGTGYVLEGVVKSARDCSPIPEARIEFWLVNTDGKYDDDHRATVLVNSSGRYSFESNFPKSYGGRPAHIHVRVTAPGYEALVTQHYPKARDTRMTYDLVLVPVKGFKS
jgi:protocatechuate 3,4-dioxygenase beta subunit